MTENDRLTQSDIDKGERRRGVERRARERFGNVGSGIITGRSYGEGLADLGATGTPTQHPRN